MGDGYVGPNGRIILPERLKNTLIQKAMREREAREKAKNI